jgi:hypothetical protein
MRAEIRAAMTAQHGLITRGQAVDLGVAPDQIDRLTRTRAWTIVRRGVYAETSFVRSLTSRQDRQLLQDRVACLRISRDHVRSHDTAAHELGLEFLLPADPMTHVTRRPYVVGTHQRYGVKHHVAPYRDDQVVEANGCRCLGPARTALDIAREHGSPAGLSAVDSARRAGITLDELWRAEQGMRSWPGVTKVREAIELSDPGADNPGETLARELVTELGFGPPQTQFGLAADGRTAWCDLRLGRHLFEFDGRTKYRRLDEGGAATTSAEDVVWREKRRQDWICGFRLGMSRIAWADFWGAARLVALVRLRREYLQTCAAFGESIADLAPYLARGPRPRWGPRIDAA